MREHLQAMQTEDNESFVRADIALHLRIAQATGNQSLLQIMRSIRSLMEVWITRVAYAPGTRPATWDEHAAVYESIDRRDPEAARAAMSDHMDGATTRLLGTLAEADRAAPTAGHVRAGGTET